MADESVEWAIRRRIDSFEEVVNNPSKVLEMIDDTETHPITTSKQDKYYINKNFSTKEERT